MIADRVINVIAKSERISPEKITIETTFEELGMDSLDGMNVIFELEEEFHITIPDEAAKQVRSVRDVVEELKKIMPSEVEPQVQTTIA